MNRGYKQENYWQHSDKDNFDEDNSQQENSDQVASESENMNLGVLNKTNMGRNTLDMKSASRLVLTRESWNNKI